IDDLAGFPLGACVYVEDLLTGEMIAAEVNQELIIGINEPYQGSRLLIHSTPPVKIFTHDADCYGATSASIELEMEDGSCNVQVSDASGTVIFEGTGSTIIENILPSYYEIALGHPGMLCSTQQSYVFLNEPLQIVPSISFFNIA